MTPSSFVFGLYLTKSPLLRVHSKYTLSFGPERNLSAKTSYLAAFVAAKSSQWSPQCDFSKAISLKHSVRGMAKTPLLHHLRQIANFVVTTFKAEE